MNLSQCYTVLTRSIQAVDAPYYNLVTTYEPSGIVRERVFCYELYHQMRLLLGDLAGLSLNGEIDKRGHPSFEHEHQRNPDFVFHIPGTFSGNTLAIEVKGKIEGYTRKIVHDFDTLLTLVTGYEYSGGAFVLYNHHCGELVSALAQELRLLAEREGADRITVLCSPAAHADIEVHNLKELGRSAAI